MFDSPAAAATGAPTRLRSAHARARSGPGPQPRVCPAGAPWPTLAAEHGGGYDATTAGDRPAGGERAAGGDRAAGAAGAAAGAAGAGGAAAGSAGTGAAGSAGAAGTGAAGSAGAAGTGAAGSAGAAGTGAAGTGAAGAAGSAGAAGTGAAGSAGAAAGAGAAGTGAAGAAAGAGAVAGDGAGVDAGIEVVGSVLVGVAEQLREVAGVELEAGELSAVEGCVAALRGAERALAAVRAQVVGCAARSQAARAAGAASIAQYLRDRLGVSAREAKRQAELARVLAVLPGTAQALADGAVGQEQAEAIGRSARSGRLGDPEQTEQQLLEVAAGRSPEELVRHIREREQAADRDGVGGDERRARAQRRASISRRSDGMWQLSGLLDGEAGETLATAIHAFARPDPAGTPVPQRRRPEQRTADGLVALAQAGLAAGAPAAGGLRPQVSVVIPAGGLRPGGDAPGVGAFGTVLCPEAVQRLACDAGLSWLVTDGVSRVLAAGRSTREWTAAQRRALAAIHGGCRGPACDRPMGWCDIHHVTWWSRDGHTDLDNGLPLCGAHHRLVHDDGWTLVYDPATGAATFTSPTGATVTTHPRGVHHGHDPARDPARSTAAPGTACDRASGTASGADRPERAAGEPPQPGPTPDRSSAATLFGPEAYPGGTDPPG